MQLYTLPILTDHINQCVKAAAAYSHYYFLCFDLIRNTGCRPSEIFNPGRWSIYDSNNVSLRPSKGNNLRIISNSLIHPDILTSIADGQIITSFMSLSSLNRYFGYCYPHRPLGILSTSSIQPIALYVMRHRAFKVKFNELGNYRDTGAYFGEIDSQNTANYVNSQLFYT